MPPQPTCELPSCAAAATLNKLAPPFSGGAERLGADRAAEGPNGEAGGTNTSSGVEGGCSFCAFVDVGRKIKMDSWANIRLVMLMEKVQAQQMRSVPTEVVCV